MSVPNVQGAARPTLVSLTEEHLTVLIRESIAVQRHCKRARIHLPGGTTPDASKEHQGVAKRRLHAEDVNMALQWRGSEKIYATGTVGANSSEDKKVILEDYIKSEMELRPPQEVGLTVHWLAVDGVQPEIPRNPFPGTSKIPQSATGTHMEDTANTESGDGVQVTQLLPRLLSEELQLYFTRVTTAVERGGSTPTTRQQQDATFASIGTDAGLQELVPFLVNYVSKSLYQHVGNADHCRTLVRMARSLLVNPHLHLELHLHQLLPALLTCVVAERLSTRPWENHWALRNEAAMALVQACDLFGDDYATLKARVLKTVCDAAGPDKCLPTQYGGFVAISLFGPKAINAFLLPLAFEYWKAWETKLEETKDLEQRLELQMCQQAVLNALGVFLEQDSSDTPDSMRISWEELAETFGDRLAMLCSEETEYALCAI